MNWHSSCRERRYLNNVRDVLIIMSHRRKEKKKVERREVEIKTDGEYEVARSLMFRAADRMKELVDSKGFDIGQIKDCAPLFEFRCIHCRSKKIALYHFENAVIVSCVKCNNMEIVGSPKKK